MQTLALPPGPAEGSPNTPHALYAKFLGVSEPNPQVQAFGLGYAENTVAPVGLLAPNP